MRPAQSRSSDRLRLWILISLMEAMTDAAGSPEEIGGNDFMSPSQIDFDDFFPEAWLSFPPQKD
jgi:hypothetical protein